MAYNNEVKLKLKKTVLDAGTTIMTDTGNKYILEYGEALYINNHNAATSLVAATGNDYLTFGSHNNDVTYDPETGTPSRTITETIKTHNQFFKAQTKDRVDRAVFYPDNITPKDNDRVNNISTQFINDQGINVYPTTLPAVKIANFDVLTTDTWSLVDGTSNIYKCERPITLTDVTNKTKVDLSCIGSVLQKMLINNIYSLHIENQNGTLYLYAFSYQKPAEITLNLQASLQETFTDVTNIIGDGVVASDGNNIEFGNSAPVNSKAKLWINTVTGLAYFKNGSNWTTIASAFG